MAINSTIYKATLHIADMDRQYYQEHQLTIAKHSSETDERLMVRVLAFALYASEALEFGKGISSEDEPALWRKDLAGAIELWIEVGVPDERRIRKACGRAKQVVVITYGRRNAAEMWWEQNKAELSKRSKLTVLHLVTEQTQALAALAARTMTLSCTIEDGQISMMSEMGTVALEPIFLK
jgi:uncharacterized protein YaeQ